ncbi:hypothetical protein GF312_14980 [Candidatus Poribacteria bacterium]|nr:hypothetical protein [Candidatus Poribacteria bacterium]
MPIAPVNMEENMAKAKIALVAGKDSHGSGSHEHSAGCALFADLLNRHVDGVDAVVYKGWPQTPEALEDIAAVVVYSDGGGGHPVIPHLEQLDKLAAQGVGIMMMHYAVEVPTGEAGQRFLDWIGGYFETHWSVNPHWTADFTEFPEHPINNGMTPFSMEDEWYYHMRFRESMEGVTPLLSTVPPESTLTRPDGPHSGNPHVRKAVANKEPQHLGWCVEREDGGRGVGFTGGHYHDKWAVDQLRMFIINAIVWTAGLEVPEGGISTPKPTKEELDSYLPK